MNKFVLPVAALLLFVNLCVAQETPFRCGHPQLDYEFENNPNVRAADEALEQFTKQFILENEGITRDGSDPLYIIPVVFHVIHDYGIENISDAQIHDAIRVMNLHFRKLNADTAFTVPAFQALAADCQIEFRLARKDPNGLCHNGIDRIASTQTYYGESSSKLNQWPNNKYLNVWVVKAIQSGAAGYANYPSSAQISPGTDGIMILHSYVGSIGTSTATRSTALSHEVGHYLNLRHTWGNTNSPGVACGDDQVNDTPITKGWTNCNTNGSVCTAGVTENVQNFMEYAYCSTMFTQGQRNRMHAALNSSTGGRSNLWTQGNLFATGTDHLNYGECAPKPVISPALTRFVCAGDSLRFNHYTTHGPANNWNWTLDGGTPSSSTDSAAYAFYNTPGLYNVSLTVTNDAGSNSTTRNNYVKVLPATGQLTAAGYVENFDGFSFVNSDWVVINPEGNGWAPITNVGYSGTTSLRLNAIGQLEDMADHFITPAYDLSGLGNAPVLQFRVAHAQRLTSNTDMLRVYSSTNCGQTWQLRYSKSGPSLTTAASPVSSSFVPNASQWRQETVNLPALAGLTNVRFRFEFTYKGGNNIYIDDINFNPEFVTVAPVANELALSVFPNPATGNELAMSFVLPEAMNAMSVELVSVEGRTAVLRSAERMDAGHHLLRLSLDDVAAGYYILWLRSGDRAWSRPVIVKR